MRRLLCILLTGTFCAWATNYTLISSGGVWGRAANWSPAGVPGNGDTVNIPDGMNVTVQDQVTVGASGGPGSVAVSLNNSGEIVLFEGSTLIVRGNVAYSGNTSGIANTGTAVLMEAGSSFVFDSSAAASPFTTPYTFGPSSTFGMRPFVSNGTPLRRNTVSSNVQGAAGQLSMNGQGGGGGTLYATYTDFSNIGDANNPGWQVYYMVNASHLVQWNVTHSTFTNCGPVQGDNLVGIEDGGTFVHAYNSHRRSAQAAIFTNWVNIASYSSGARLIRNDVFDVPLTSPASPFQAAGFTFWSNYFAQGMTIGAGVWNDFQGNFYRWPNSSINEVLQLGGSAENNFWLLDEPISDNPHGLYISPYIASTVTGDVVDHAGEITGSVSAWWQTNLPAQTGNYYYTNSILLPNESGNTSWWFNASVAPISGIPTVFIEHNTAMVNAAWGGFGTISWHPTTPQTPAGLIGSYRSNILWNPTSTGEAYKLFSFCHSDPNGSCTSNLNPGLPANLDYNDGWNMLNDGNGYTNGGNGYADNFSSVPGQHDLSINPMFTDSSRNMATFDSAYLGYSEPQWSSSASYVNGALVSNADSSIWNGATVNYRYVNGTYTGEYGAQGFTAGTATCNGANPKPGDYTLLSRACWEWASLYRIRQAIEASATGNLSCPGTGAHAGIWNSFTGICSWDDQTIGAHAVDVITTLIQWIRAGYAPTNPLLAGTAHDGTDVGAVAVSLGVPIVSPGGTGIRGRLRSVGR